MKRYLVLSLFYFLATVCFAQGKNSFLRSYEIGLTANLNQTRIAGAGGALYLNMEISTPDIRYNERKPLNLAVVLDRSGSMADERKMEYAKAAINSLIDRLSENDYLSIVIYDDRVDVLASRQRVTQKSRLKRLVNEVYPRGATNLGSGMLEGFRQLNNSKDNEYINRVILLSDGLANAGVTDPYELNSIASRYRMKSVSLTAIGVGLDYNENLMLGLAERGGGNYYYIESPTQLAAMFERELNGVSSVVAQNAVLEITLGKNVTLADAIGYERKQSGNTWLIPVGDLYAGDRRELTLELIIPEGSGKKHVAKGELNFDSRIAGIIKKPKFSVDIQYSNDVTELERGHNWDVQGKVDVALSTRKVEQAMQSLDQGNTVEAEETIQSAVSLIRGGRAMSNSAVAAPMLNEQIMRLEQLNTELKDSSKDARAKKKSIQYKNYSVQKKRQ